MTLDEIEYQVWRHVPSGERYIVEVDETGQVVAAVGPVYHGDIAEMLRTGVWVSDAELVAALVEDGDDYELDERRAAPDVD